MSNSPIAIRFGGACSSWPKTFRTKSDKMSSGAGKLNELLDTKKTSNHCQCKSRLSYSSWLWLWPIPNNSFNLGPTFASPLLAHKLRFVLLMYPQQYSVALQPRERCLPGACRHPEIRPWRFELVLMMPNRFNS